MRTHEWVSLFVALIEYLSERFNVRFETSKRDQQTAYFPYIFPTLNSCMRVLFERMSGVALSYLSFYYMRATLLKRNYPKIQNIVA